MEFTYTAINAQGATIQDRVKAENEDHAVRRLQGQGYVILKLVTAGGLAKEESGAAKRAAKPSHRRSRRIKMEQVVALSREFAIMIETGVPVVEALNLLIEHDESLAIHDALIATRNDLSEGKTMSQAMGLHPRVFPKLYVDMVRTAEAGGNLGETLNRAADYLESALEMRRKVTSALTYPAVLLFVAFGVLIFMMTYILPQFKDLFIRMGGQVPLPTMILLSISDFVSSHWWLIPIILIGGIAGLRAFLAKPVGRRVLAIVLMRLPIVGDTVKKVAMARILRSLGTLLNSGVSMLTALETSAQTAQNALYEEAMLQASRQVEEGQSLTEAINGVGIFPGMICQMMAVGEKSGRLSSILLRVASFYENEVDARLKMLASVLEPLMIVVLGVIVGFIAIAVITPIYSMMDNVK